ncbi:MAG TPA: hypothetical protein VEK55_06230 [Xanthobacteraceae bacterium]|nr:hypothetical protein [Xanthobacteraceae bacterium]
MDQVSNALGFFTNGRNHEHRGTRKKNGPMRSRPASEPSDSWISNLSPHKVRPKRAQVVGIYIIKYILNQQTNCRCLTGSVMTHHLSESLNMIPRALFGNANALSGIATDTPRSPFGFLTMEEELNLPASTFTISADQVPLIIELQDQTPQIIVHD